MSLATAKPAVPPLAALASSSSPLEAGWGLKDAAAAANDAAAAAVSSANANPLWIIPIGMACFFAAAAAVMAFE